MVHREAPPRITPWDGSLSASQTDERPGLDEHRGAGATSAGDVVGAARVHDVGEAPPFLDLCWRLSKLAEPLITSHFYLAPI